MKQIIVMSQQLVRTILDHSTALATKGLPEVACHVKVHFHFTCIIYTFIINDLYINLFIYTTSPNGKIT